MQTARTVLALIVREMTESYGRSPGGHLWSILQPVATIALLSLVFSLSFRAPTLGTNFQLFYATGVLPFQLYMQGGNKVASALGYSRHLMRFGRVTFLDPLIARFVLVAITHSVVFAVVLSGIYVFYDLRVSLEIPSILLAFGLAAGLGLGIGTLNCALFAVSPAWRQIWLVLSAPMFILSSTLFTYESIPISFREYLWYNPLIHIVGLMRRGVYASYDAPYVSVAYVLGVSMVALFLGLAFLKRYHWRALVA